MLTAPEMGSMIFSNWRSYILTWRGIHGRRLDLIDKAALFAGDDNHAGKMRISLDWIVFEWMKCGETKTKIRIRVTMMS